MTRQTVTILAAVLCAFTASTAALAARALHAHRQARGYHRQPPREPASPPARPAPAAQPDHRLTVYPGPVPIGMVMRAITWWNSAGADVELALAAPPQNANIVIEPFHSLPGTIVGDTETPCATPCRPRGPETITLSSPSDYNQLTTLTHELGHALGLGHTHVRSCSIMAPIQGEGCPNNQLPDTVPEIDREDLIRIWGPSPVQQHRPSFERTRL